MYKDTVTIFNRFKNKSGDTWYPSILHNVNINLDKATIMETAERMGKTRP